MENKSVTNKDSSGVELSRFDKAMAIFDKIPITEQHVTKIIDTLATIAEKRTEQAIREAQTTDKIRIMIADFERDAARCDHAAQYLRELKDLMTPEEVSWVAAAIPKIILGVSPNDL
jgi:hypothetical protein